MSHASHGNEALCVTRYIRVQVHIPTARREVYSDDVSRHLPLVVVIPPPGASGLGS